MIHLLLAVIYLSFISLGLPDSLLGSAWPSMYGEFGVPVSYAGAVSMIIALCTVISSLQSDRLTRMLGTGRVTAVSVAMTAVALYAFSVSRSFWLLCFWAVPYGLGAGSVDASLNNYVALHYKSSRYELAPLYVGAGSRHRALCHGICSVWGRRMEYGLSVHWLDADRTHRNPGGESPPLAHPQGRECRDGC